MLGDSQLEWEAKEQAAELLADLASTLLLVSEACLWLPGCQALL